ncbi:hypothetical protein KPH14_008079 [Odynerus spinipes]|uniref:Glutamyl-tRNA(Gln) amidotransferase subunit B, mitochondrial n=1 Tax=Odynerus spinipes TaxID=1348599 RepID=A0AAD9RK66_9HYME|nr:hypothetical protein KPH14_008079 [Odynerus spinipes]
MNISVKTSWFLTKCQQNIIIRFPRIYLSTQEHITEKKWKPTIGLEIHAKISSNSKMFSAASTKFEKPVNSCVSFFDCATPGTMPVLNRKCVEAGVTTALALSCSLNEISIFERKHYFYADLPAGYQITQSKQPLAVDGQLCFLVFTSGIHKEPYVKISKIKQIQLEQDSGRTLQSEFTERNLIDLNRAGVPLMELVFEPDLSDGEEAAAAVKELMNILKILGTCSCKMEEGALRIDANVSVSHDSKTLGVRTELKNIGSVRGVANAIRYEIERQIKILEKGQSIVNETRSWDAINKKTVPLREKEEKQDYRFMPETDLLPLRICLEGTSNESNLVDATVLKKQLPELPNEIRKRLKEKYNLTQHSILQLSNDLELLQLFTDLMKTNRNLDPKIVANFITYEVMSFLYNNKLQLEFCKDHLRYISEITELLQSREITPLIAVRLLNRLLIELDKMPKQIVEENNWKSINDERELEIICKQIIEDNPAIVKKYKAGKQRSNIYDCRNRSKTLSLLAQPRE